MAVDLFVYGSLRHLPLLQIVLDRPEGAIARRAARLPDHAVHAAAEGPFPMLVAKGGQVAEGLLLEGLGAQDLARLDHYEAGFDFDTEEHALEDGTIARVYRAAPGACTPQGPWDLDRWARDWGEMSCHAAREIMSYVGRLTGDEIAQRFSQIRTRAWSKVLAARQQPRQDSFDGTVEIAQRCRPYSGFFTLEEAELRHSTFAGGRSALLSRSWLVGSDAALVLPYDPVRDRVMLIEQMRVGPLGRGDAQIWQLEPIAGRVDPGEAPETCARREAQEEAGLTIGALESAGNCYASPGTTTDFFHMFVGIADLPDDAAGLGGLETEHEDIRSHLMSFAALMEMAERGALVNAPLALLAYWLSHHRSRLRSGAGAAR